MPPIPNRTPLAERAEVINARQELGHWDADAVVSMQSKPAINVLHERLTRVVRITRLADKSAAETETAICQQLKAFPAAARRSITYDNGTENYQHEVIHTALGTTSYFCQPYHSWKKGAVENSNGLFRRFFPKKTDFAQVTQAEHDAVGAMRLELKQAMEKYNTYRPHHSLNGMTPAAYTQKILGGTSLSHML